MANISIKNAFQRFWAHVQVGLSGKQDAITGTEGQFVVIGADGKPVAATIPNAEEAEF